MTTCQGWGKGRYGMEMKLNLICHSQKSELIITESQIYTYFLSYGGKSHQGFEAKRIQDCLWEVNQGRKWFFFHYKPFCTTLFF